MSILSNATINFQKLNKTMQIHACHWCMQCCDVPAVEGRTKITLLWGIYIQDCYQHLLMIISVSSDLGWRVLSNCTRLLASVGAACHSDSGDKYEQLLFFIHDIHVVRGLKPSICHSGPLIFF